MLPIVFVLLILCTSAFSDTSPDIAQTMIIMHDTCVKKIGVDESLIKPCMKGIFADDPKLKCYMKCLLDYISVMTDDGDINVDTLITMILPELKEIAVPTLRSCGTVKGADACETAFLTHKCWQGMDPVNYYIP